MQKRKNVGEILVVRIFGGNI